MYAYLAAFRQWFYQKRLFKSVSFDLPIINVGNLAVGGSGKTPHIEYLIRVLQPGFQVATLSRGYGRKTRGFKEVMISGQPIEFGDESLQIKRKFPEVRVFVGEDRVEAITALLLEAPDTEVILLDDAFQHLPLKAGLNLLLTDFAKPFTRDKSMPWGRLREFPKAADRAEAVIVTKCPSLISENQKDQLKLELTEFTQAPIYFSFLKYGSLYTFKDQSIPHWPSKPEIMLLTGLAQPGLMAQYLQEQYKPKVFKHFAFSDHHLFTKNEIEKVIAAYHQLDSSKAVMVVSEKDLQRLLLPQFDTLIADINIFVLPVEVDFKDHTSDFNQWIINYVRQASTNYSIP